MARILRKWLPSGLVIKDIIGSMSDFEKLLIRCYFSLSLLVPLLYSVMQLGPIRALTLGNLGILGIFFNIYLILVVVYLEKLPSFLVELFSYKPFISIGLLIISIMDWLIGYPAELLYESFFQGSISILFISLFIKIRRLAYIKMSSIANEENSEITMSER
ncbi:MAG: hypothetical protein KDD61_01435 [Bdellovibrionales bacterium]|nr:hypothetical protein [Bdellovibrionales bacterium]